MDDLSLPVPFQYFHLLSVLIVANQFFMAYGLAFTPSMFGIPVFILASMIFLGMMEVASDLSDPFGDDEVDFPISAWIAEWFHQMVMIAEHELPVGTHEWEHVAAKQKPLIPVEPDSYFFHPST